MTEFDVFLSHNSKDKPIVRQLADALVARGLRPWLDERELVPGRVWQEAVEQIIQSTNAAIVMFGPAGLGPWEEPEMRACLTEFVDRKLPVIPVLLPGAPQRPVLPLFLRAFTWVDMRGGLNEDGLDRLVWGITGRKPPSLASPAGSGAQVPIDIRRAFTDTDRNRLHTVITGQKPDRFGGASEELRATGPALLHNVPFPPAHPVARPRDLERVRRMVLDGGRARVGITAPSALAVSSRVGVHGMGGIGKTVLAVFLAHDKLIRDHFYDGVYWLTVG
jgi:hypothetical protein